MLQIASRPREKEPPAFAAADRNTSDVLPLGRAVPLVEGQFLRLSLFADGGERRCVFDGYTVHARPTQDQHVYPGTH